MSQSINISAEDHEHLQLKYDALIRATALMCKYLDDWETHRTSGYLNKARHYRRETESLIRKENEEKSSKQRTIFK